MGQSKWWFWKVYIPPRAIAFAKNVAENTVVCLRTSTMANTRAMAAKHERRRFWPALADRRRKPWESKAEAVEGCEYLKDGRAERDGKFGSLKTKPFGLDTECEIWIPSFMSWRWEVLIATNSWWQRWSLYPDKVICQPNVVLHPTHHLEGHTEGNTLDRKKLIVSRCFDFKLWCVETRAGMLQNLIMHVRRKSRGINGYANVLLVNCIWKRF